MPDESLIDDQQAEMIPAGTAVGTGMGIDTVAGRSITDTIADGMASAGSMHANNIGYQYHLFLSYRRRPPVSDWVRTHFLDRLTEWLRETLDEEPNIFIDHDSIETGDEWPLVLRQALLTSCLLVPVFSPSYFRSKWCMAEFLTMRARERRLGLRTQRHPWGLILPIRPDSANSAVS